MSNLFKDGVSGYLFSTEQEAIRDLSRINRLNRWEVRQWADAVLQIRRVVDEYEELFTSFKY